MRPARGSCCEERAERAPRYLFSRVPGVGLVRHERPSPHGIAGDCYWRNA